MREKKYLCHQKFSNNSLTKQNIMKKITQFAMTLALMLMGGVNVYAQEDEVIDFDGSFYHNWSEVSATATDNGEAGGGVVIGEEVALGGTIWGNLTGAVPYLYYANITEYSELRFEGTPGAVIRLMCNRTTDEGPIYEIKPTIGEDGKLTVSISDLKFLNGGTPCDFVCLQSIKVPAGWQGGTTAATITSIKIVKPGDPLAIPKTELKNAINEGKQRKAIGKTEESFAALQDAIADGEAALVDAEATAETLANAKTAIEDAIAGLQLAEGYTALTSDMYFDWTDPENPVALNIATVLFASTGQPYGDPSVKYFNYADLTEYDKLVIGVATGTPRVMFNRAEPLAEGSEGYDPNGGAYVQFTDEPVDGIVEIDLNQWDFAHLNAIKGANWQNVTVTDLLLYKEPAAPVAVEVTFDFNAMDHPVSSNADQNAGNIPEEGEVYSTDEVSLTIGWGANSSNTAFNRFWSTNNGPQLRMYSGSLELVAAEGYAITSVVFNHNGNWGKPNNSLINTINGEENTTATWEGNSTNVALEVAGNTQMNSIVVTLAEKNEETTTYTWVGTGIQTVKAAQMENVYFDLAGRRVAQPAKGLYIVNGKKVVK